MNRTIRPVSIGLLLGVLGLLFGIFWAMYITVNHEKIHAAFSESAGAARGRLHAPEEHGKDAGASHDHAGSEGHDSGPHAHDAAEAHDGGAAHMTDEKSMDEAAPADAHVHGLKATHNEDPAAAAHERLTRGHIHAMGLGILTISVSLVISLTAAPNALKTLASACIGVGSLFYPFAWIIMGYRTPSIGVEAAQESVFLIAAMSIVLVLAGLFICLFYLLKGMVAGENA